MTISRRAFVKTAGAAVAAATAAVPAAAAVEPMTLVDGVAGLASVPEPPFKWWVSLDGGECFSDTCDTREEAAEIARGYGGGIIAECQQEEFDLRITDNALYDAMRAANEDAIGDGDFVDWTNEQGAELMDEVNAVIAAWAARHGINRTAWKFGCVRNQEKIIADKEQSK